MIALRPYPVPHIVHHDQHLDIVVHRRGHERRPKDSRGQYRKSFLEVQVQYCTEQTGPEEDSDCNPLGARVVELLHDDERSDPEKKPEVEPGHEESHVLHQHGDESAEEAGRQSHSDFALQGEQLLLQTDQVGEHRAEDEAGQEHSRFEESVSCWVQELG